MPKSCTQPLIRTLARKSALYILAMFMVLSLNFCLIHLMPGDSLIHLLGEEGYAHLSARGTDALEALKAELDIGGPPGAKFVTYLKKSITGDWGWSYHYGQPVAWVIGRRMLWTLLLLVPAVLASTVLGAWLGALSGWRNRGPLRSGRFLPILFLCLYSIPGYCLGLLLLLGAAHTDMIPLGGMMSSTATPWAAARHMALPLAVLIVHGTAYKFLIMHNTVRQELDAAYVLTALSRGLTARRVLFGHVLRNALLPYVSVVALNIGFMVGGTLLVEVVFSWQGMGTLIYNAVLSRDYPMLSGALMVLGLSVLAANFAADLCYALIDPRIREGGAID